MEVNDQTQALSTLMLATSIQYLPDRTVSWSDCAGEQQTYFALLGNELRLPGW